jgi:methylated-DNA-protein-cysteine methyltransferase related protein
MGTGEPMTESVARAERIRAVVASIPKGSVASYGEVADRAGLPRGARIVGRTLAGCAADLPWHRVLNAAGRISLPAGSPAYREQVRRLRAEGVLVESGRVPIRFFRWRNTGLDELLWGPRARPVRRAGCPG